MDVAGCVADLHALVDTVRNRTGAERVDFLAHSMGGLVLRAYTAQYPTEVGTMIFLGTPQGGAPKMYYVMMTGVTGLGWYDRVMSNAGIKRLAANAQGLYNLLPRDTIDQPFDYIRIRKDNGPIPSPTPQPGVNGGRPYPTCVSGDFGSSDMSSLPENLRVANAEIHRQAFQTCSGLGQTKGMTACLISGYDVATPRWIEFQSSYDDGTDPISCKYTYSDILMSACGDGTVPLDSSCGVFSGIEPGFYDTTLFLRGIEHGTYLSNAAVFPYIDALLEGTSIPQGGLETLEEVRDEIRCGSFTKVSSLSPVRIFAIDESGHRTGDLDGSLIREIEGTQIIPYGEHEMLILPNDRVFTIVCEGTAIGSFSIVIQRIVGESAVSGWAFVSVATTPAAISEFEVYDGSIVSSLRNDLDGDGYSDEEREAEGLPIIASQPTATALEGSSYAYGVNVIQGQDEVVRLELLEHPIGMDIDDEAGLVTWLPICGTYTVMIRASGSLGGPDVQAFTLDVACTTPSTAVAGQDQILRAGLNRQATAPLDGSSSHGHGPIVSYQWMWATGTATGVNPTITLPVGKTTISLVVNDGRFDSTADSVDITVLRLSDLTNDGRVDTADYSAWRATYGKRVGQAGFNPDADYDKDGVVSLKDYQVWYQDYKAGN
jgi:hypothetical protein